MLADPEFRQAVCTYQAVEDSGVTIEEYDDGSMTVDLDRTYGTALVPSFARKFVGATSTWCSGRNGPRRPRRRSRSPSPASRVR